MWDLRKPSGIFFSILGALLCLMGVLSPDTRAPLTEANVNLYVGVVMLAFGGMLLWLARKSA